MYHTNGYSTVLDRMLTLSQAMNQAFGTERDESMSAENGQYWLPAVDTYETEDAFLVRADLPGVTAEEVEIGFEQNTLTFKGKRAATLKVPEQGEIRVFNAERVSGPFARAIRLPEYVDAERIEATFANGVLEVRIPKAAAARPRKIEVRKAI